MTKMVIRTLDQDTMNQIIQTLKLQPHHLIWKDLKKDLALHQKINIRDLDIMKTLKSSEEKARKNSQ